MKFRRNVKDEKAFLWAAIGSLVFLAILLVIFIITRDNELLYLIIPAIPVPPLLFYISISTKSNLSNLKKTKSF